MFKSYSSCIFLIFFFIVLVQVMVLPRYNNSLIPGLQFFLMGSAFKQLQGKAEQHIIICHSQAMSSFFIMFLRNTIIPWPVVMMPVIFNWFLVDKQKQLSIITLFCLLNRNPVVLGVFLTAFVAFSVIYILIISEKFKVSNRPFCQLWCNRFLLQATFHPIGLTFFV